MLYDGMTESLWELESDPTLWLSPEMAEFESDVEGMRRAAELAGKRGYGVVDAVVHTMRHHRLVEKVETLLVDELKHQDYLTLTCRVVLKGGCDIHFDTLIKRR